MIASNRRAVTPDYQDVFNRQPEAFARRQLLDQSGDMVRDYERRRADAELGYQRGQLQGTNAFDATQRALTGGDSTGALWASTLAAPSGVKPNPGGPNFGYADQAYNSETRRQALTGLMGAFQGMAGGAAPGLNISGPNGPIASVNYQTSINPQQQVYNPQPGMTQMQAAPPHAAGPGGQAFANNYAGMAQANANTLSRGATQGQANYNMAATQAQQQGALAGLGQQNRAANNRSQRQSRMFGTGTNMMSGLLG